MSARIHGLLDKNPLYRINVLVVDDDKRFLHLVKNVLNSFGFTKIHLCHNGEEALKILKTTKFELIITDWKMEPVSGYDLVYFIRNDPQSSDFFVPIIMLSGMAERHHVEDARDIGITEFLSKPFTIDNFRQRIISVFDTPREFIFASAYSGPNRRRHNESIQTSTDRRRDE